MILKILGKILPPFHPLKYWWITFRYGKQKAEWTNYGRTWEEIIESLNLNK